MAAHGGVALGTGPVQVDAGRLGGTGTLTGTVTIGTGSGSGAFLSPGILRPGKLGIQSDLIFNSDATLECYLNANKVTADRITANSVTIAAGATFALIVRGTAALQVGQVFTMISNKSAGPVNGTFSDLPDGGIITVGNNTFQANYEGGDGNDLTLTVIP
jgi:hypothetical protein